MTDFLVNFRNISKIYEDFRQFFSMLVRNRFDWTVGYLLLRDKHRYFPQVGDRVDSPPCCLRKSREGGGGVGAEVLHCTYSSESQSDFPSSSSSSSSCDFSVRLNSSSDSLKLRSVTEVPLNERSVTEVTLTVMSPPLVELTEIRETRLKIPKSQKITC